MPLQPLILAKSRSFHAAMGQKRRQGCLFSSSLLNGSFIPSSILGLLTTVYRQILIVVPAIEVLASYLPRLSKYVPMCIPVMFTLNLCFNWVLWPPQISSLL
jgi:hypothetical protein